MVEHSTNLILINLVIPETIFHSYNNFMERYLIIFKGQVQGVGFRYTCQRIATELDLTGSAKNLDNGNVEVEIQGDEDKIMAFISKMLKQGSYLSVDGFKVRNFIRIEDYYLKKIPCKQENNFKILY